MLLRFYIFRHLNSVLWERERQGKVDIRYILAIVGCSTEPNIVFIVDNHKSHNVMLCVKKKLKIYKARWGNSRTCLSFSRQAESHFFLIVRTAIYCFTSITTETWILKQKHRRFYWGALSRPSLYQLYCNSHFES